MPRDREALTAVVHARRGLAERATGHARADGDFERVSLPHEDGEALRDLFIAEQARSKPFGADSGP